VRDPFNRVPIGRNRVQEKAGAHGESNHHEEGEERREEGKENLSLSADSYNRCGFPPSIRRVLSTKRPM
jgi:hypothetical protein